jgi:hypothetical protein
MLMKVFSLQFCCLLAFLLAYGLWRFTANFFLAYGKKSKFGEKPEKR